MATAPKFSAIRSDYTRRWASMVIKASMVDDVDRAARTILAGFDRASDGYIAISQATGVPAAFIGLAHYRESSCNFSRHLHNGDPLTARTRQVPKGRPPAPGEPPFTFFESACDALLWEGLDKITDWCIERGLYELEGYNGWGPYFRKTPSGYIWSGSNQYVRGKFIADHVWSATAVDQQLGVALILKRMSELDPRANMDPPKKPIVTTIKQSPSLRMQTVGIFGSIAAFIDSTTQWISNGFASFVNMLPGVHSDVQSVLTPAQETAASLGIPWSQICLGIGIVAVTFSIIRQLPNKQRGM